MKEEYATYYTPMSILNFVFVGDFVLGNQPFDSGRN